MIPDTSKRPHIVGRCFCFLIVAALATLTVSLFASGSPFVLSVLLGWMFAAGAGVAGLFSSIGRGRPIYWQLGVAALLIAIHSAIASRAMRILPLIIDNPPVVNGCLRGLHNSLQAYAQKTGAYPESLTDLVSGEAGRELLHPKNLVSPMDPANTYRYSYDEWPSGLIYSSYVYRRGRGPFLPDAHIILAFEYGDWQPLSLCLFPEYGRFVLFGNGEVRLLSAAGFNENLRADVARRRQLGWPEQMSRPVGLCPDQE